jgi:putative membrane protein
MYQWGGYGGAGWLGMLFFWLLVFAGLGILIMWLMHSDSHNELPRVRHHLTDESSTNSDALAIVRERYAKGEIDKAEYEQKIQDLK